jgi:hypothetical protein
MYTIQKLLSSYAAIIQYPSIPGLLLPCPEFTQEVVKSGGLPLKELIRAIQIIRDNSIERFQCQKENGNGEVFYSHVNRINLKLLEHSY